MSEANVEVLRQMAATWNRRDLEAYLEVIHPKAEWQTGATRVEGAAYQGHTGIRQWWADTGGSFEELVVTLDEVRDLDDTVVGLGRLQGRSREGIPVDTEYGVVIRCRDGLAVWGSDWCRHSDALQAAGLRE